MKRRLVVHAVLAATTVAVFWPLLGRGLQMPEVGELFFYADAMRAGLVPGVDYAVDVTGPGRYVLLSVLFELFGRSLAPVWGLLLFVRLAISGLAWELARRYVDDTRAVLPVVCLWIAPGALPGGFVMAGVLALALALALYLEQPSRGRAVALGLVLAVVAWFRLDLGLLGVVATGLVTLGVRARRGDLGVALAPLGGGLLGSAARLHLRHEECLRAVVGQLGDGAASAWAQRHPRMPGWSELSAFDSGDPWLLWLPVPVYLMLLLVLARAVGLGGRDATTAVRRRKVGLLLLLGAPALFPLLLRADAGRLLQVAPLVWLTLTLLLARQEDFALGLGQRGRSWAARAAALAIPFVLGLHLVSSHPDDLSTGTFTLGQERVLSLQTRIGEVWLNPRERDTLAPLLAHLERLPAGPLWAAGHEPLLYALAGRADVSGFASVAGFAGSRPRGRLVIDRVEAARPPVAVYSEGSARGPKLLLSVASPRVHAYLLSSYEEVARYGDWVVMERSDRLVAP